MFISLFIRDGFVDILGCLGFRYFGVIDCFYGWFVDCVGSLCVDIVLDWCCLW